MQHRLHSDPYPLDTFRVNCRAAAWGRLNPSQQPSAIPSTGRAAGSGTDLARGPQLLGSLDIILEKKAWEAKDEAFYFPMGKPGADDADSDTDVVDGGSDAEE